MNCGIETDDDGIRPAGRIPAVDPLLGEPRRGVRGGHDLQPGIPALALEAAGADDEDAQHGRGDLGAAEIERGRPGRADDAVGRHRGSHAAEPRDVVGPEVHRVVRHVHHGVAAGGAIGQGRGHAGHGRRAAIDDAVEVDEEQHAPDRSPCGRGPYHQLMPRRSTDPLAGVTRLLVDGSNLLHALGEGGRPLGATAVTGRLRALVPPGVAITVVLDGAPAPGAAERRPAGGLEVRYAGRRSADVVLAEIAASHPEGTLVVTDDRELGTAVRAVGARTAGTAWLGDRLARQRLSAPAAGRPGAPAWSGTSRAPGDHDAPDHDDAPRWKPGRGATRKVGNPRRGRRPS